jgi:ubiquitin carboxyl-terminal hydrolase 22/27/51
MQGRRGLLNLGQTCFLNVVLQSFLHNPLLRNYFLSDQHNFKLCKRKACTCCEMDKLFIEVCLVYRFLIDDDRDEHL